MLIKQITSDQKIVYFAYLRHILTGAQIFYVDVPMDGMVVTTRNWAVVMTSLPQHQTKVCRFWRRKST